MELCVVREGELLLRKYQVDYLCHQKQYALQYTLFSGDELCM